MTLLRVEPVAGRDLDHAIASLDAAELIRTADAALIGVTGADVDRVVRALAFAGIRATAAPEVPVPRSLPAIGRDLHALPLGSLDLDTVRIERLPLGAATREVLFRRFAALRPPAPDAIAKCRALMDGADVLFGWERRAWASARCLRDGSVRRSLRPVVFDRGALGRSRLTGRAFASEGALGRWLFA